MRRTQDLAEVAGRVYWRESEARQIVDAWRRSGELVSVFAGRLGIDRRRVSRWAARLEPTTDAAFRFVPVRVADDRAEGRGAAIDIELGHGRRVRVSAGFATDDLRRVLAILKEGMSC